MGRQDVWGWLRGKDFFFSSVKTSSFITDKSDRWKPIKKKILLTSAWLLRRSSSVFPTPLQ